MFNFTVRTSYWGRDISRTEKSSNNKTANFVRVRGTRNVHEDNKHCSQLHSADCLFICMCTGRLAEPVVVWVACSTHFFININALVLWIQNVQNVGRKTLSSMVSATSAPTAIMSGRLIIAFLKRNKLLCFILFSVVNYEKSGRGNRCITP